MLKKTAKFILPKIAGNTLCKPLLGGVSFRVLKNSMSAGLTVTLRPRTARRCTIILETKNLLRTHKTVQTVHHAKKTIECPWCTSVNHYVYVWKGQLRCERCLPIPILEDPKLAEELNLIPQYNWEPIPSGHVYASGMIYIDGRIYASD